MAPKGLEYVGDDFGFFDDDKDIVEEIRILSDEQDIIYDPLKDTWSPLYPEMNHLALKAKETLKNKIGLKTVTQNLDPNDLDPTQTLFLDTILDWAKQCIKCKKELKPFPPLKVKLLGVAGTGKSRTIKTFVQEFDRLMINSDLLEKDQGRIIMCAPTGVAAYNIGCGAASVHRTFFIPVKSKFTDFSGERQKQLEQAFENAWLVIIDEISMVGCEMFAKLNERLVQAKLDENLLISNAQQNPSLQRPPFGGIGMVVCGDFGQLIPIMQHSLMDDTPLQLYDNPKPSHLFTNKGKNLFQDFKICIILTKQHRQNGVAYTDLCLKLRDGTLTPEDHNLLQNRHYEYIDGQEKEDLTNKGTRLVATNQQAGKYNAKTLIRTAKKSRVKIFRINAQETGHKPDYKPVTASENFGGLKSTIHLTIGSRVMMTSNILVEAGLINGAQGTVMDIVFENQDTDDQLPCYVLVCLDSYNGPSLFSDHNKANWVPIFPITRQHDIKKHIERAQIPLRLSSAMTGHKVQGLSLYHGAVVEYPSDEQLKSRKCRDPMDTWGFNYCILTRVPDFNKIAFLNLPDYIRHMKLYNKSKGKKDYFKMFQKFDKKAYKEFAHFVQFCTNKSLDFLSNATEKLNISGPINFYSALQQNQYMPETIESSDFHHPPRNVEKSNEISAPSKFANIQVQPLNKNSVHHPAPSRPMNIEQQSVNRSSVYHPVIP